MITGRFSLQDPGESSLSSTRYFFLTLGVSTAGFCLNLYTPAVCAEIRCILALVCFGSVLNWVGGSVFPTHRYCFRR